MSNVYAIGDLHFGHKNIHTFRQLSGIDSEEAHRAYLIEKWNSVITKRDIVYVLGDAAFTIEGLESIGQLKGRKILVRGNHDLVHAKDYLEYFDDVFGIVKYKNAWLSHAPIHPGELRRKINIHGHVHYASIHYRVDSTGIQGYRDLLDEQYYNVSVENCRGHEPVPMAQLLAGDRTQLVDLRPEARPKLGRFKNEDM